MAAGGLVLAAPPLLAQEFKPQTWKMAIPVGERSWFGQMHRWWGAEVEKRSGGRIKIQYFWSDSLVKWADALPGIQSGIADLAWVSSTYYPAKFPNYMMLDNVFNFGDDYVAAIRAAIDTMENQPDLKAELVKEDLVFLMPHTSGHAPVGTKQPLKSIRELKGKTLRTYGGVRVQFYQALGANPIFMTFPEMYQAMERGTVDALGDMALLLSNAFKLFEVARHVHMANPPGVKGNGGALASGFFMTGKKYRELPPDLQKMFMDLRAEYAVRYGQTLMDDEATIRNEWINKHKATFQNSSPEDEKVLVEAANAANEQMFKKQESDGHRNVRAVWSHFQGARKKFEAERK
jgi:TRAP-type C4-dicarboxylate transport system substrate-binding protein